MRGLVVALSAGLWVSSGNMAEAAQKAQNPPSDAKIEAKDTTYIEFPPELVDFVPYEGNPVFAGTGKDTWDRRIRERGYILREGGTYHLWYTGYNKNRANGTKYLGYASSPDGFKWTRHPENPVFDECWTEDMHVVRHKDTYYMVAEGRKDVAHLLTSKDRVHWKEQGRLDVRYTNGRPLKPGSYATPVLWIENDIWYLFFERGDLSIWVATSKDHKVWTNVQDEPVIVLGPDHYDSRFIAANQIVKYKGRYYLYYHAHAKGAYAAQPWTTCVAVSTDLIHWKKYPQNPIIRTNDSSGSLVDDGKQYRLYTMHPDMRVYFPRTTSTTKGIYRPAQAETKK